MLFTVASFKGGVGKTTTSIHLAGFLSNQGRVAVVDLDENESAKEYAKGGELPFDVMTEDEASGKLRSYQHVIFDTQARASDEDMLELAKGSDLLVIPSTPDALSLRALLKTVDLLERTGQTYRVLLTVVPPYPSQAGDEAKAALRDAGVPTFETLIRRGAAYQHAALQGVLVNQVSDKRSSTLWNDYRRFGREVLDDVQG